MFTVSFVIMKEKNERKPKANLIPYQPEFKGDGYEGVRPGNIPRELRKKVIKAIVVAREGLSTLEFNNISKLYPQASWPFGEYTDVFDFYPNGRLANSYHKRGNNEFLCEVRGIFKFRDTEVKITQLLGYDAEKVEQFQTDNSMTIYFGLRSDSV